MGALGLFTKAHSMIMMMSIIIIITKMVVMLMMKEERLSIGALGFIHHGSRSDTTREQLKPPNNVTQSEKNNNVTQSEKSKCVKLKANIF